jgi:hypothetical protein
VIRISDVVIDGDLDFESSALVAPIAFDRVVLETVNFEQAEAPGIYIWNSQLKELKATQLKTGNLDLRGTTCTAGVILVDARIPGVLDLGGAKLGVEDDKLAHPRGCALDAHNIHVEGDLFARRLKARGKVSFSGGRVEGCMSLKDADLENSGDWALNAQSLKVGNGLDLSGEVKGGVQLGIADIKGPLNVRGAHISGSSDGTRPALSASLMRVDGDLFCGRRPEVSGGESEGPGPLKVTGMLSLLGAHIEGRLTLTNVEVVRPGEKALFAEGIEVGDRLDAAGLTVRGKCNLVRARVGDAFDCSDAKFSEGLDLQHATMRELTARRVRVVGGVCRLASAKISDDFDCSNAEFGGQANTREDVTARLEVDGSGREALFAEGIEVGDRLNAVGLTVRGKCNLVRARVGDAFDCSDAKFSEGLDLQHAILGELIARRVRVVGGVCRLASAAISDQFDCVEAIFSGGLHLQHATMGQLTARNVRVDGGACCLSSATIKDDFDCSDAKFETGINLQQATTRNLIDSRTFWPSETSRETVLNDFAYTSLYDIHGKEDSVDNRIRWVSSHGDYSPQVYNQLAGAYRDAGEGVSAGKVLMAKQRAKSKERRKRAHIPLKQILFVWDRLLDWTTGYGYRPLRIFWWMSSLLFIGWMMFGRLLGGQVVPRPQSGTQESDLITWLYVIDLLFPVANIGHRASFLTHAQAVLWSGLFTLAGWVICLIVAASVASLFKRD